MAEQVQDKDDDRRVQIPDKTKTVHFVHRSVFKVRNHCPKCGGGNGENGVGTCFLLDALNRIPGCSNFYSFVTAAHVIYCSVHKCYKWVRIAFTWRSGENDPSVSFPPKPIYIEEESNWGWLSVSKGYQDECGAGKTDYDRFPHDYGVIAVCKAKVAIRDPTVHAYLLEVESQNHMYRVQEARVNFDPQAFICGYPHEVKGQQKPARDMYWVPPSASQTGSQATYSDVETRRLGERGFASLYSMPQCHLSPEGDGNFASDMESFTGTSLVKTRLFRHYIDTSDGQSGSAAYIIEKDGNDELYSAAGIHVGFWEIKGTGDMFTCNVAVRLSEVLSYMKEWVKAKNAMKLPDKEVTRNTESATEAVFQPETRLLSIAARQKKEHTAAEAVPGPAAAAATAATAAVTAPKTGGYGSRLLKDVDDLGELAGKLGNSLGEGPRQHLGKEAVRLTGGKPGDAAATLNEYLSNHESEIEGKKVVINVHVILKFLAASVDKNGGDITLQQLEDLLTHKKVAPQSSRTFQDLLSADDLFDD